MEQSKLQENFSSFAGLDYRSNDKTRNPRFLRQSTNVDLVSNGSISCRRGRKGFAKSHGGGGLVDFIYKKSGVRYEELITIDDNLWRLKTGEMTIVYVGTDPNRSFEVVPEMVGTTYTYKAKVVEGTATVLDVDIGTGIDTVTVYDITTLVAAIDALANFTCVLTSGDGSTPAAFIPNGMVSIETAPGTSIKFYYWEQIPCPTTNPFSTFWANRNSSTFENASFLSLSDRLFIATGHNELYKYDSISTYRAGMPTGSTPTFVSAVPGTVTAGSHNWSITYEFIDALGKITEGNMGEDYTRVVAVGGEDVTLNLPTLQPGSQFQTACAIVAGAQTGVNTIVVDNGSGGVHTMSVGQTAYFYDGVTGGYVERTILAVDTTPPTYSITVDGAPVNVRDNAIISCNLRINLWRTTAGGVFKYLVQSFPNNSFVSFIQYDPGAGTATTTDRMTDANLILQPEYTEPVVGNGLPPANLKYLCSFNTLAIGADGTDVVYFSDFDGPEYWNSNFIVRSASNEPVTGLAGTRDILVVFKEDEVHVVRGSLPDSRYRQEQLSNAVGCSSHQSIALIGGAVWYYSALWGIRRILSSGVPESLSYRIEPIFRLKATSPEEQIQHKRVVIGVFPVIEQAVAFIPCESEAPSSIIYPNENCLALATNYTTQYQQDTDPTSGESFPALKWNRWKNIQAIGGAVQYDGKILMLERKYSETLSAMEYVLSEYQNTSSENDICDFGQPIEWEVETGWMDLGNAEQLKKFLKATIYSFAIDFAPSFTVNVSTEVNFINGQPHSQKRLSFGGGGTSGGWSSWVWNNVPWGEATDSREVFPFRPTITNAIKFVFEATLYKQQPLISGWSIEAVPALKPHIKTQ